VTANRSHVLVYVGGAMALALALTVGCRSERSGNEQVEPEAASSAPSPTAPRVAERAVTRLSVPDEVLVDQHGQRVRLASDVFGDGVAVVDFVFTRCTTICSPMTATLAQTQKLLAKQGIDDVRFVSITLDPSGDTPERLRAFVEPFQPLPGWSFVTGERAAVERATRLLQGALGVKEAHAPVFVVGSRRTGVWTRIFGLVPPARIVDEVAKARAALAEQNAVGAKG
jgi:protein SCO1/2